MLITKVVGFEIIVSRVSKEFLKKHTEVEEYIPPMQRQALNNLQNYNKKIFILFMGSLFSTGTMDQIESSRLLGNYR